MARARNIKPGFFRNADLVELPFEARLLFIGLWTIADRAGRIEDRPKQIKMELFPADSVDVDALLDELAAIGVVARYSHDGKRYLQVVNFSKHQNPHKDEKASTIPDQDGHLATQEPDKKKHSANTVQAPCNNDSDTVAIGLIPDSGFSDSLIPESKGETAPRKRVTTPVTAKPDDVDPQTWADWLSLRKAKRAPVTTTVVDEARRECAKAGMTLENFLRVWCRRGSQGLEAAWLKPDERGHATGETAYQRSMRERIEEAAPSIARRAPAQQQDATDYFRTVDVPARDVTRHAIEVQP